MLLLKICLHYVELESELESDGKDLEWVDMGPKGRGPAQIPQPYPTVDFLFSESPESASAKEEKKIKEAALISLLRVVGIPSTSAGGKAVSELTVERGVGAALSGIFYSSNKVHVVRRVSFRLLTADE